MVIDVISGISVLTHLNDIGAISSSRAMAEFNISDVLLNGIERRNKVPVTAYWSAYLLNSC